MEYHWIPSNTKTIRDQDTTCRPLGDQLVAQASSLCTDYWFLLILCLKLFLSLKVDPKIKTSRSRHLPLTYYVETTFAQKHWIVISQFFGCGTWMENCRKWKVSIMMSLSPSSELAQHCFIRRGSLWKLCPSYFLSGNYSQVKSLLCQKGSSSNH